MSGPVVTAIRHFVRRVDYEPGLIEYERVVYKAALSEQGANVQRICDAAAADSLVMLDAVHSGRASKTSHP